MLKAKVAHTNGQQNSDSDLVNSTFDLLLYNVFSLMTFHVLNSPSTIEVRMGYHSEVMTCRISCTLLPS